MKQDVKAKEFLRNPENFADAFNYYLFDGEQVIKGSDLEEKDAEELLFAGMPRRSRAYQRQRDLLRGCTIKSDGRMTYVLLGIESQSKLHYAMPVRNLLYDALDYAAQVKSISDQHDKSGDRLNPDEFLSGIAAEDRIIPVITLVIYWGDSKWDAPTKLSDMFTDTDDRLKDYISDYSINLITPHDIKDFNKFHSELGEVLEIIKRQREENLPDKLIKEKGSDWTMSRSAVEMIGEYTNTGISSGSTREDRVEMKNAFQLLEERGEKRGLDKLLIGQICKKLARGMDVPAIAKEVEEPEEKVSIICEIATKYAPDYDVEAILKKMRAD